MERKHGKFSTTNTFFKQMPDFRKPIIINLLVMNNVMKKILFAIAIAMAFIGCDIPESQEYEVQENENTRFQMVYSQRGYNTINIYLDKQTGVKYLYVSGGHDYGSGLTKLEE